MERVVEAARLSGVQPDLDRRRWRTFRWDEAESDACLGVGQVGDEHGRLETRAVPSVRAREAGKVANHVSRGGNRQGRHGREEEPSVVHERENDSIGRLHFAAVIEIPDGFEKVDGTLYRKGDDLLLVADLSDGSIVVGFRVNREAEPKEDFGPPPGGCEWTGEVRPPKKGEYFWSEIRGRVIQAVEDETGVNRLGEPTGGRR